MKSYEMYGNYANLESFGNYEDDADEQDEKDDINEMNIYSIDDYFELYEKEELSYFDGVNDFDDFNNFNNFKEYSMYTDTDIEIKTEPVPEITGKMTAASIRRKYKMRTFQSLSFILVICVMAAGILISRYQNYQTYLSSFQSLPYSDIIPLNQDDESLTAIPKAVYDQDMDIYINAAEMSESAGANVSIEALLQYTQKHQMRYINQIAVNLPNGCEIVSLAMVLSKYIPDISVQDINTKYLPKKALSELQNGLYTADDPTYYYIGEPDKAGYGIFAPGLMQTAKNAIEAYKLDNSAANINYISDISDISGCSEEELFQYVSDGYPVIVWYTMKLQPVSWERHYWYLPNGSLYWYPENQHCGVIVEYTKSTVTLFDPTDGIVEYPKELFVQRWNELGPYPDIVRQAIVIK